ncbi:2-hydroxychromene-2-carboxylate isomerase [Caenimonas sedimenti]|uniref:2-hydroxychromene-2-carboxylate isomerase n=1 Tax=Caenimonas sedimenti TaxID=2596921 RepID=A0A562ZPI6_9BURK|nr:2-hydroxychromene-2-carboxylate isomerase [Caenimonas sedimenti]TWO70291.1 2-hydroxychromene-2-carboxylate isomerase [Caenimonas sedimenti]
MAKPVDFYFDFGSPAAYLAWTQMPRIAAETGATVNYKPFLLGGVFQSTGNKSPMEVPAKGKYMLDDLQRFATRYGVQFAHNPHFPINTLMLMRGATGLQLRDPAKLLPYGDAVYKAIWVDGKNMGDPATVGGVLQAAGFNPQELLALTAEQEVKDKLKADTAEAVARGVFGAPTFFIDGRMYWGQDRLDFVKEALQ